MSPIEIQWVQQTIVETANMLIKHFNARIDRRKEHQAAMDERLARLEKRVYGDEAYPEPYPVPEAFRDAFKNND